MLRINMEYINGILFVRLEGILNRKTTYKINNYLIPSIMKHHIKYLVYNLKDINFIDEEGIDALLNTKYAIKNNEGKIYLCDVNKSIIKIINKTKIKKTINEEKAYKLLEA